MTAVDIESLRRKYNEARGEVLLKRSQYLTDDLDAHDAGLRAVAEAAADGELAIALDDAQRLRVMVTAVKAERDAAVARAEAAESYHEAHVDTWQGELNALLDEADVPPVEGHDAWHRIQDRIGRLRDDRDDCLTRAERAEAEVGRLRRVLGAVEYNRGGMPGEVADAVRAVLDEFVALYGSGPLFAQRMMAWYVMRGVHGSMSNQHNDDVPPGLRAWMTSVEAEGPYFFGVDRSGTSFLDRPAVPAPPRPMWSRLRDAWAGMVSGWKGEVGYDE